MGHRHFASSESPETHKGKHGYGTEAPRHSLMADVIRNRHVPITEGMGMGACEGMKNYNIDPIVTDVNNADEAIRLYTEGKLTNIMERIH